MTIEIRNHRVDCEFVAAADHGGKFAMGEPRYIILHYTAGANFSGALSTLTDEDSTFVSSHMLVGLDGRLAQFLPFDTVAWHAGKSEWNGLEDLNDHAIGIELVNPGYARDGITYSGPTIRARHPKGGPERDWYLYPEAQVNRVVELCVALRRAYPSIIDILGHDQVSLSGKIDPGPAWYWDEFHARMLAEAVRTGRGTPDASMRVAMSITDVDLQRWFMSQGPRTCDQVDRCMELNEAALMFARKLVVFTPPGADLHAAVRKVREAMYTAEAAIAAEADALKL